jgi:hypothetical protein
MLKLFKNIFLKKKPLGTEVDDIPEVWRRYLGHDPIQDIRQHIIKLIEQQIARTRVAQLKIIGGQTHLARTYPSKLPGVDKQIFRAIALLVYFKARVDCEGEASEKLQGAFSWLAFDLDQKDSREQLYLDLGKDVKTANERLRFRIYECGDDNDDDI